MSVGTGRARTAWEARGNRAWPHGRFHWLPPTILVAALVLELALPPRYGFSSLLSAAVVLAALSYRAVVAACFGVLTVVLMVLSHVVSGDLYAEQVAGAVANVTVVSALATLLAAVRDRTERQLTRVRAVAEAAQLALLRPLPKQLNNVSLAGFYQAADDEALIGGDLYSVRPTDYGVRVLVGDVRGKGIGATETVATVISSFREAAMVCPTLPDIAERIEAAMALDRSDATTGASRAPGTSQDSGEELFATAVLMEFPPDSGGIRVLDRGHPPVLRVDGHGTTPLDAEYGLPLGLGDLAPEGGPATGDFTLAPGELLVAYSDGVTEARDRSGVFYPLQGRLNDQYGGRGAGSTAVIAPTEVVNFVQRDVTSWAASLTDDVVVLVLQPFASPATGPETDADAEEHTTAGRTARTEESGRPEQAGRAGQARP